MIASPEICAVTLNWNRPADTLTCLETLAKQTHALQQIIVVDNGSTDDSIGQIKEKFPSVKLLANPTNLGFAGGANLGIRAALQEGADMVFLVNNDTLIDSQAVERLVTQARPDVGILTPLIYYGHDRKRIWSAGGKLHAWTLETYGDDRGRTDLGQWPEPVERDFVTGCGMLLARELLERVGLFDERFFMYYEDSDLCLRARREGFLVLLVPSAKMWHNVARSSGGSDSTDERYWMARSSVLFFRKQAVGVQWLVVFPWRAGSALRTTFRLFRLRRWDACRAYWRGLLDGFRSE